MNTYTFTTDGEKTCAKCGKTYPRTTEFFHKDRNRPDGLHYYCKECKRALANDAYRQRQGRPAPVYKVLSPTAEALQPERKTCTRCGQSYPATVEYFCRLRDALHVWCRSCQREAARRYGRARRDAVLEAYGGVPPRCACCGEDERAFLTIDHINGGGRKEYAALGSNTVFYQRLMREGFPPGYRVLCHNCNSATHTLGVCPHVKF